MPYADDEEKRAYKARWNREKRAKIKAEQPEQHLKNLAVGREVARLRNADPANAAENRRRARQWRVDNPEKAKEQDRRKKKDYAKTYYQANREKQIEAAKKWARDNPLSAARNAEMSRPVRAYEGYYEFGGVCEACGDAIESRAKAHGDHCHDKMHFRGWLCRGCNMGLGHLRDSVDRIKGLLDYVRRDLRRQLKRK